MLASHSKSGCAYVPGAPLTSDSCGTPPTQGRVNPNLGSTSHIGQVLLFKQDIIYHAWTIMTKVRFLAVHFFL